MPPSPVPRGQRSDKRTNAQIICLAPRSQPPCSAVARVFVSRVSRPPGRGGASAESFDRGTSRSEIPALPSPRHRRSKLRSSVSPPPQTLRCFAAVPLRGDARLRRAESPRPRLSSPWRGMLKGEPPPPWIEEGGMCGWSPRRPGRWGRDRAGSFPTTWRFDGSSPWPPSTSAILKRPCGLPALY